MIFLHGYLYHKNPTDFFKPEYHYLAWALSLLQLKKFGYKVILHTDKKGKEILIDKLQLPYDDCNPGLEGIEFNRSYLQTAVKVHVCEIQKEPFVFVDGDLFIWEAIPEQILNADLICQNMEIDSFDMWFFNQRLKKAKIDIEPGHKTIHSGILGFNDCGHMKAYAKTLHQFLNENAGKFHDPYFFAACSEPFFAYRYAIENNLTIGSLLPYPVYKGYTNLGSFHNRPFSHMMGREKRNLQNCKDLTAYMEEHYTDYYKRILKLNE